MNMRRITNCLNVVFCVMLIMPIYCSDAWAEIKNFSINGDHGKLVGYINTPNKEHYPVFILLHGFNASKEMPLLRSISDKLVAQGIATVLFDFNGHGQSDGRFEDMTIPNEFNDAQKVYKYVSAMPYVTSISVGGHSQGGLVASLLAGELGEKKISSLVLLAPASVLKDMATYGNLFGIHYDTTNLPDSIEIPGCCRVGKEYVETARNLPIYETAAKYHGPVLLLHAPSDSLVPVKYGHDYENIYDNDTWGYFVGIEQADHNFNGFNNEVAQVISDFLAENIVNK